MGVHLLFTEEGQEDTIYAFLDSLGLGFIWAAFYIYQDFVSMKFTFTNLR